MKTLVEGKCSICKQPIKPADSQAPFNRNKGLHMWKAHDIQSPHAANHRRYTRRYTKRARLNGNGIMDLDQVTQSAPVPTIKTSAAEPALLDHCPNCKTRFYLVKGT